MRRRLLTRFLHVALGLATLVASPALQRNVQAQSQIDLKDIANPRRRSMAQIQVLQEERCQIFQRWALQLTERHLNINLSRAAAGADTEAAQKAVAEIVTDELFVPFFGKPYDQITPREFLGLKSEVIDQCLDRLPSELTQLAYVFEPNYPTVTWSPAKLAPLVAAARALPPLPRPAPTATRSSASATAGAPRFPDRRLAPFGSARNDDDRCALLMTWLSRATEEGSQGSLSHGGVLLFRDEEFVPLFGQPYDRTTEKWRRDIFEGPIAKCSRNQRASTIDLKRPAKTYAEQFRIFGDVLDAGFIRGAGNLSMRTITMVVVDARTNRAEMEATIAGAYALPTTSAAFETIRSQRTPEASSVPGFFYASQPHLWPSELAFFADAMNKRLAAMVSSIGETIVTELERGPADLATAHRFHSQIVANSKIFGAAPEETRQRLSDRAFARFRAIFEAVANERRDELFRAPSTMAGAVQTAPAQARFDREFGTFDENFAIDYQDPAPAKLIQARYQDVVTPLTKAARATIAEGRQRILTGSLPQWRRIIDSAPDLASLQEPAGFLRNGFAETERSGSLYKEYETLLVRKAGLDLSSMTYPGILTNIYLGRFRLLANNSYYKGESANRFVLEAYIVKFWEQCERVLPQPPNRREIVLIETETWSNAFGPISIQQTKRPTGIFTTPEFHTAYTSERPNERFGLLGEAFRMLTSSPNPLNVYGQMLSTSREVHNDMALFLQRQDCDSAPTKRFAENLLRLFQDRPPVPPVLD